MTAVVIVAYIAIALWLTAKPKAEVATSQPEVEQQPIAEDPWTEPTNVIQFPKFTFTSETHTFEAQPAVDYSSMTIRELKAIASERKLKGYSRMTKATLITALAA